MKHVAKPLIVFVLLTVSGKRGKKQLTQTPIDTGKDRQCKKKKKSDLVSSLKEAIYLDTCECHLCFLYALYLK